MMHQTANPNARCQYRVTLALYPDKWEDLRNAAKHEGVTGQILIEQIIEQWLHHYTPRLEALNTEPDPEDA